MTPTLPQLARDRVFLTDGGLETTLVFHRGIDLPAFAAFPLLDTEEGRAAYAAARVLMTRERYLEAVSVLRPMANNPHGGASLQPVRDLLAEASALAGLEPAMVEAPPEPAPDAEGEETAPAAP